MQDEITALREERERARKEREQRNKRRRLLLTSQLDPELKVSIVPPARLSPKSPDAAKVEGSGTKGTLSNGIGVDAKSAHDNGTSASTGMETTNKLASTKSHIVPSTSTSNGNEKGASSKEKLKPSTREHILDGRYEQGSTHQEQRNTTKEQDKVDSHGSHKRKVESSKTSSSTTQSSATATFIPKNDYSQHFVDTKQRPQNFIRDAELADRFEEYPKLRELIQLKDQLSRSRATPPMYMKTDLRTFDLTSLGSKFDVILIDPPWEEYSRRTPALLGSSTGLDAPFWTLEEMMNLQIDQIAENPSFLFLWVGSAEGLDQGRGLLRKWGFRRCEDICWLKTNKQSQDTGNVSKGDLKQLFHHTKEHCLVGIKGTVRRNQDGHIIHANIDTDVIISEEPPSGSLQKPEELYHIIEHFSLGRRRLELFGHDHNIRHGWVTVGLDVSSSNYSAHSFQAFFTGEAGHLLGSTPEIEALRPKSPPRNQPVAHNNHHPHPRHNGHIQNGHTNHHHPRGGHSRHDASHHHPHPSKYPPREDHGYGHHSHPALPPPRHPLHNPAGGYYKEKQHWPPPYRTSHSR